MFQLPTHISVYCDRCERKWTAIRVLSDPKQPRRFLCMAHWKEEYLGDRAQSQVPNVQKAGE
jgi:hypothetical protein